RFTLHAALPETHDKTAMCAAMKSFQFEVWLRFGAGQFQNLLHNRASLFSSSEISRVGDRCPALVQTRVRYDIACAPASVLSTGITQRVPRSIVLTWSPRHRRACRF